MFRCKHDWNIVIEKTLPSAYEQLTEDAKTRMTSAGNAADLFNVTHIVILKCIHCGKIYKSVESSLTV